MNGYQKLRQENVALAAERSTLKQGMDDLRNYLLSPKFASGDRLDGYVNVQDVLARLREVHEAALTAGEDAAAKFQAEADITKQRQQEEPAY
jgi:hypothetical protein